MLLQKFPRSCPAKTAVPPNDEQGEKRNTTTIDPLNRPLPGKTQGRACSNKGNPRTMPCRPDPSVPTSPKLAKLASRSLTLGAQKKLPASSRKKKRTKIQRAREPHTINNKRKQSSFFPRNDPENATVAPP